MQGYATVNMGGRIANAPELRYKTNGDPVVSFQVAVSRPLETDFRKRPYVHYIDCVKAGDGAEAVVKDFKKGDAVEVVGKLNHLRWDRPGSKGSKLIVEVVVLEHLQPVATEGAA